MVVDEEMEEEVPAGASPGVHDAGTPDPRRDSIASEPSSSRRDSIASVPSTSRRPAEPCARCGFDVGQHRAIVGAARLACACWLCLQCLGSWQAAAMHTGTVPVCPTCGDTVAACEGYYALGPSGPVAGEWVPFDGFGIPCIKTCVHRVTVKCGVLKAYVGVLVGVDVLVIHALRACPGRGIACESLECVRRKAPLFLV